MVSWLADDWNPPPSTPLPLLSLLWSWIIMSFTFRVVPERRFPPPRAALHSPRLPLYFPASLLLRPTSALSTHPLKCILWSLLPAIAFIKRQARLRVPYRSGPRRGDGTCVAPPSLRGLPVLLVGPLEHFLHVADLVLAHSRHVHVTPETTRTQAISHERQGEVSDETAAKRDAEISIYI